MTNLSKKYEQMNNNLDILDSQYISLKKQLEKDAGNRHWYKIATGVEITTGTEQAGTQREKTKKKEAEEQRMFELKQRKKREKHKGH